MNRKRFKLIQLTHKYGNGIYDVGHIACCCSIMGNILERNCLVEICKKQTQSLVHLHFGFKYNRDFADNLYLFF